MGSLIGFFLTTKAGRILGLILLAGAVYGGIYAKGYFAAREDQRVKQIKNNEIATQQRRDIDKAVPRTDWDDRVDELR